MPERTSELESSKPKSGSSIQTKEKVSAHVVIVGAGATGLSCAHELLREKDSDDISVIVLEARDRIGGRIYSEPQEKQHIDGTTQVQFVLDHGAAWVHGTGFDWPKPAATANEEEEKKSAETVVASPYENPMMSLLQQVTPPGQDVCSTHLNPVFEFGNPWMRPQTVVHAPGNMVLYVGGKRIPSSSGVIEKAVNKHFEIMQDVSQIGEDMFDCGNGMDTANFSLEQIVSRVTSKPKYSSKKKKGNKVQTKQDMLIETIVPFYRYLIECWYACPAKDLPLYTFVESSSESDDDESLAKSSYASDDSSEWDEDYVPDGDFYGPHCTVRNGMKTVLEPLLDDRVKSCIRCNQEVVSIRDDDDSVFVRTRTGLEIQADVCVVTVSVGCLQHAISTETIFEPPLGQEKVEAVFARRMGGYKKVFLTFDRIFWPSDEPFIGLIRKMTHNAVNGEGAHGLGNYLLLDNLWAKDGVPCLEAVLFGTVATDAIQKTDHEIKNDVLAFMEDAMGREGQLGDWCVDCHVTRWEEDPFSRGAYSSYQIGTMERHAQELTKPEWDGKLMLAGEAGNPEHEGSVHGALFSGTKTAETIQTTLLRTRK